MRHIEGGKGKKDNSLLPSIDGKIKYAFTLSETLIALVIIGIIAAITIPAISRSSEKYILKNQFKKTYSTLLNAMNKADTDLGGNTLCYYHAGASDNSSQISDCNIFFNQIFENMSIQKICNRNAKRDGCIPTPYMKQYITSSNYSGFLQDKIENTNIVANLADGTIIIRYAYAMPIFMVDINGAKGPNELGKDIFIFLIRKPDGGGLYFAVSGLNQNAYFTNLLNIYKE